MRLLLLLLAITPVFANEVKNGGDLIFMALTKAKDEASYRIEKIRLSAVEKNEDLVVPLLKKHRKDMGTDLRKTKLKLLPEGKRNANGNCAQTNDQRNGDITVDLEYCKKSDMFKNLTGSFSEEAAITLFYNEVSHHFGLDDDDSARFAISVTEAYKRGIIPRDKAFYKGKFQFDQKISKSVFEPSILIHSENMILVEINNSMTKLLTQNCGVELKRLYFKSTPRLTFPLRGESKGIIEGVDPSDFSTSPAFASYQATIGDDGEDVSIVLKFTSQTQDLYCPDAKVKEIKLDLKRVEKKDIVEQVVKVDLPEKKYTNEALRWVYTGSETEKPDHRFGIWNYIYNSIHP